jgi:hypothetical protein
MIHKPTWHTVMNADASPVVVLAPTWKVHVRPLVNGGFAYLVRLSIRWSIDVSKANQAILDSEWTWSHSIWGDDDQKIAANAVIYKLWMRRRMNEIFDLWEVGSQYVGTVVHLDMNGGK